MHKHIGHQIGNNYSVQANIMETYVCAAMGFAFENTRGDLADRMMASLEAAENIGGDLRGKQSDYANCYRQSNWYCLERYCDGYTN